MPLAITASVFFHPVRAMQQLLYSASSNLFSCCDQCVPITQSDIGGVWHARVVMDYERSYIYLYTVVLLAIYDVLARTLLYRFAQHKVV